MAAVAEEDKTRQLMGNLLRDLPLGQIDVTGLTLRYGRKARTLPLSSALMTGYALQLQRRVLLVVEWQVFAGTPQTHGKE